MDPETGETVEITAEDSFAGIHRLVDAFEKMNGQSTLDKLCELRAQFYLHTCHKEGELVANYSSRIADLRADGVKLPDAELGWLYKEKLGLYPLRKQLLEMAFGGTEGYATIESEALRLFRDLHSQDPMFRRFDGPTNKLTIWRMFSPPATAPSSTTTSGALRPVVLRFLQWHLHLGSWPGGRQQARQVHVSEAAAEDEAEEVSEVLGEDPAGEGTERSWLQGPWCRRWWASQGPWPWFGQE